MSHRDRHEGISCDSCGKSNFRGRRYKCLLCYDYDLCSACYNFGAVSGRHTTDHAMQCLITRADYDTYFGGEAIPVDMPQSYTCPLCNSCGFTQALLEEHVTSEHAGCGSGEVICPICASTPSTDAEIISEDLATHLIQHSRTSRSDLDDSTSSRHMRRIFNCNRIPASVRSRRMNMQSNSNSSQMRDNLATNLRDSNIDPIAELLSQLSGSRTRSQQQSVISAPSHLQQLHLQMQMQGQQQSRQNSSEWTYKKSSSTASATTTSASSSNTITVTHQVSNSTNTTNHESTTLLAERTTDSKLTDEEQHSIERERANRGLFVQQLFLSSLTEKFNDEELQLLYHRDSDDFNKPS